MFERATIAYVEPKNFASWRSPAREWARAVDIDTRALPISPKIVDYITRSDLAKSKAEYAIVFITEHDVKLAVDAVKYFRDNAVFVLCAGSAISYPGIKKLAAAAGINDSQLISINLAFPAGMGPYSHITAPIDYILRLGSGSESGSCTPEDIVLS